MASLRRRGPHGVKRIRQVGQPHELGDPRLRSLGANLLPATEPNTSSHARHEERSTPLRSSSCALERSTALSLWDRIAPAQRNSMASSQRWGTTNFSDFGVEADTDAALGINLFRFLCTSCTSRRLGRSRSHPCRTVWQHCWNAGDEHALWIAGPICMQSTDDAVQVA